MKKTVRSILLIDDDDTTNFLHTLTIQKSGLVDTVHVTETVQEAIYFLEALPGENWPDLIFLDVNLPGLSGWDFMVHYQKLVRPTAKTTRVIMLTASVNKEDELQALRTTGIEVFKIKPLTLTMLKELVEAYI